MQNISRGEVWLVNLEPQVGAETEDSNGVTVLSAADAFQVKSLSVERFISRKGVLTSDQVNDIAAAVGIVIQVF